MKRILELLFLFLVGGFIYISIEILFRGYSHWTMFILGGLCFLCCGGINEILSWKTPFVLQCLIGSVAITVLEFMTGIMVNIVLKWNVWDYSDMPLNVAGQICLPFSIIWFFLAGVGILLDDYLRWKVLRQEKPHYSLF